MTCDDIRNVCSVLHCTEEPGFLALVKNGDVGMMSLCRGHLVEVRGFPALLEGLCRLRGAVMKAAAVG